MKFLTLTLTALALFIGGTTQSQAKEQYHAVKLRAQTYRTDPCLAWLVDHENGTWEANRYNGGSYWHPGEYFNNGRSYGLPQALPGSKMRSAGRDWQTNPVTQLRWMHGYVNSRYGSSCNAKAYWLRHRVY